MNATETNILKILNRNFLSGPKYIMNNLHVYNWESDYLAITTSLYAYEIEVKISHSDFIADFKKTSKHLVLSGSSNKRGVPDYKRGCPNYFWYACPPGIIQENEVPLYAGLIYVDVKTNRYSVIRSAPRIHKEKFDSSLHKLEEKFYYNMNTWKARAEDKRYGDPEEIKKKGVKQGARAVRESAWRAFQRSCPFYFMDGGNEDFPMCCNDEITEKFQFKDCYLQCERGKIFKKLLK